MKHNLACRLSLPFIAAFFLSVPALAVAGEATAHFDREKIMGQSSVFVGLNGKQIALVGPLESAMKRMDAALAGLDLSVALTEGVIDRAQRDLWKARLDERAGAFSTFFDAFQARFDSDGAAYETIFTGALERALANVTADVGGEVVECSAGAGSPFDLTGPGGAAKACPGEDVSARIGKAWDLDPVLAAELESLGAVSWPKLVSYESEESPLASTATGAAATLDGWVTPGDLVSGIPEAAELFNAISRRAEVSRRELVGQSQAVDREADDAAEQFASIRERAKELRLKAESAKAALGATLWEALPRAIKKDKRLRKKSVGICMNPSDWGACTGVDMTATVKEALLADRKLQKLLQKQLTSLGD